MAVTLTLGQLANQVRYSVTDATSDVPDFYASGLTADLAAATALVEARAPLAPDDQQNVAVTRLVGYWMDAPPAGPQRFGHNAWLQSGAAQILAPWIERRAEAI